MKRTLLLSIFILTVVFLFGCNKKTSKVTTKEKLTSTNKTTVITTTKEENIYDLSVRNATGTNGAVTCANAYASKIGLDILKKGGNAFDAAVAVAFALGVLEPYASGLGGGGVMTAYNAKTNEYIFYDFREFASLGTTMANYTSTDEMNFGGKAVAVPMDVSGLIDIYNDLGSKNVTLEDLVEGAIYYAENGYEVTSRLYVNIIYERMQEYGSDELQNIYGNGRRARRVGETITNPNYAKVLKIIAKEGKAGFYQGEIATKILEAVNSNGGVMTQDDLDMAMSATVKTTPLHTTYNGYDVYSSNLPAAGGLVLLETLNMLENYDLSKMSVDSAEFINLYSQATQLAYADKRYYVGDNRISPLTKERFVSVPVNGLLNKTYAKQRIESVYNTNSALLKDMHQDYGKACGVDPWDYETEYEKQEYAYGEVEDDGTTSLSVTDKDGNIVTITRTINKYWGSYVVPEGCGFILNNEMADFTLDENSVNKIEPLKHPISSMSPTIVMKDGKPFMTVGCPGAQTIPTAVLQVLLNVLEFKMDIQSAIEHKRTQCLQVVDTDSSYFNEGDTIYTKKLLSMDKNMGEWDSTVLEALRAMNYFTYISSDITHVYGITFKVENNKVVSFTAGADPRRDGKAFAY